LVFGYAVTPQMRCGGCMPLNPEKLNEIAAGVKAGDTPGPYTARDLLAWFGSARRGRLVVDMVRRHLKEAGLGTDPDFEYAFIDEPLTFVPRNGEPVSQSAIGTPEPLAVSLESATVMSDPTYRIGKLGSANASPVSVSPDATTAQAVTLMLYHDYSQLPVMRGEFSLKGAISWKSLGRTLALGHSCVTVRDCLEEAAVISSDTSLFAAIPTIVEKEYVLVKDAKNKIAGTVTTTDLSPAVSSVGRAVPAAGRDRKPPQTLERWQVQPGRSLLGEGSR
jgi:CBS domain-containing protein